MNKLVQTVVLAIWLGVGSAHAAVVTWTLVGVTLDDDTHVTGFFTLVDDPALNYLTDFDITTSDGTLPGRHYTPLSVPNVVLGVDRLTFNISSTAALGLFAASNIINLDGSLVPDGTISLTGTSFEKLDDLLRYVTSGSIYAIPEPSALAFLALGVGLLALGRFAHIKA